MATILDERVDQGFIIQEVLTRIAHCHGCYEIYDVDENGAQLLIDDGWFNNDDGQFCSEECYQTYLTLNP